MSLAAATALTDERAFWAAVSRLSVAELFPTRNVPVTLSHKGSVGEALQAMREHNVRALPVVQDHNGREFIGMIDVADIAVFFSDSVSSLGEDRDRDLLRSLLDQGVASIMNASRRDPLVPYYSGSPFGAFLKLLASGIHRCPVVDDRGRFVSILSQSDVLEFLWNHRAHWKSLGDFPCDSFPEKRFFDRVRTVHESYIAVDCFRKLKDENISALALIQDGALVGTLSATDVLRIRRENIDLLLQPVQRLLHSEEAWPVTLLPSATLHDAAKELLEQRLHRVWLVSEDGGAPVGLLSMTDICGVILELFPPEYK
jgi:CBS domain-containing protein